MLLAREGGGRGPGTDASHHCQECGHALAGYPLALGAGGLGLVMVGLITVLLSPVAGLALVVASVLLAGWVYLTARAPYRPGGDPTCRWHCSQRSTTSA